MRYENTYRLGPNKRFEPKVAEQVLEALLEKHLPSSRSYVNVVANRVPELVSAEAVTELKKLVDKRYRLVCSVFVAHTQPGEDYVENISKASPLAVCLI